MQGLSSQNPCPGHPHVCGESDRDLSPRNSSSGSSPRVWGKLEVTGGTWWVMRVIPTCVGKALVGVGGGWINAGHPHVCGESPTLRVDFNFTVGSSPRVWGKLDPTLDAIDRARVIPTCVGKAICLASYADLMPGHPHVCGESTTARRWDPHTYGSSPRVWGKHTRIAPR